MAFLDSNGVLYLWEKIKSKFATKDTATTSESGLMSAGDKAKLDGIASGANNYAHPAYTSRDAGLYKITVDATGHVSEAAAATKADITGLGIPGQDTTYGVATTSDAGLMSAADKAKLDGVAAGANQYTHPSYTSKTSGLYKVTVDATGHVSAASAVSKADITGLGIPAQDTTYTAATESESGLMSSSDKAKLDALPSSAALESTYAKKSDISGVYKYKGSVASESELPTTNRTAGDVYNIESASSYGAAGANVAWDGTKWDSLGEIFTIEAIGNTEIDNICV